MPNHKADHPANARAQPRNRADAATARADRAPGADPRLVAPSTGRTFLLLTGLAAVTAWAYWPVFGEMAGKWSSDPQYSHAFLVPAFSLYLLWSAKPTKTSTRQGSIHWGLPFLAAGVTLRLAGTYYYFDWLEAISLLPMLAGAALLLGGPGVLRRSWRAIAFLLFMIPLPYRVETAVSLPLQHVATLASTYALQTIGRPAFAEGNIIIVNEARIGVIEACNGLGMLLLFFALATAVTLVARLTLIERMTIIASAIPVAIVVNVVRITVTGVLHETVGNRWADVVFHDLAGWLMMPLALGLLWLERCALARLFLTDERPSGPVRLGLPRFAPAARPPGEAPAVATSR